MSAWPATPQYGLGWLELGDARQWVRRCLGAGNAALWMNFEPIADFEPPLPEGELNVRDQPMGLAGLRFPVFALGRPNEVTIDFSSAPLMMILDDGRCAL